MRVLITGVSGFVGKHLARLLASQGIETHGMVRGKQDAYRLAGIECDIHQGDSTDGESVSAIVDRVGPTHVFHLVGVMGRGENPKGYAVNILATEVVMRAAGRMSRRPVVLIAGSSAVYGDAGPGPIREDRAVAPLSSYARSKAAQESTAQCLGRDLGIEVIVARTFNLLGPGLPVGLVASDVASQVARAEVASGPRTIRVGDLSTRRDFLDVRDAVEAYAMLARWGKPGEVYNVCSGRARGVAECVDHLMRLSRVPLDLLPDPGTRRVHEIVTQEGSFEKLQARTGWVPRIGFETSCRDLLEDWRALIGREAAA